MKFFFRRTQLNNFIKIKSFNLLFIISLFIVGCASKHQLDYLRESVSMDLTEEEDSLFSKLPKVEPDRTVLLPATDDIFKSLESSWGEEIMKKWIKYLRKNYHTEYGLEQAALKRSRKDYYDAYTMYDERLGQCMEQEKMYNSDWIKELKNEYGNDYLKKHKNDIRMIIAYLGYKESLMCGLKEEEKLTYAEVQYQLSVLKYFQIFIEFIDQTDDQKSAKLKKIKKNTLLYMRILQKRTVASTLGVRAVLYHRYKARIEHVPPDMVTFLSSRPSLSRPFDSVKAINEFTELMKE